MPGLSQLKKFNSDILSLGDEVSLRASRGEQPVIVPIPKEIEDIDDSEDFVLGMPEIEAETIETQIDDDLSDITGIATGGADSSEGDGNGQPAPSFEAPDLSSLLNPINIPDDAFAGETMPDLSMFMEPEEEEEIPEEEAEPEEISIADMGLDALLAGAGFDAPEEEEEPEEEPDTFEIPDELKAVMDGDTSDSGNEPEVLDEVEPLDDVLDDSVADEADKTPDYLSDLEKDLAALDDIPGVDDSGSGAFTETGDADLSAIFDDLPKTDDLSEVTDELSESADVLSEPAEQFDDLSETADLFDAEPVENINSFDLPDDFGTAEPLDSIEPLSDVEDIGNIESAESLDEVETAEEVEEIPDDVGELGDLGNLGDLGDLGEVGDLGESGDSGELGDLGKLGDLGEVEGLGDIGESGEVGESADLGDLGSLGDSLGDFDLPEDLSFDVPEAGEEPEPIENSENFDLAETVEDAVPVDDFTEAEEINESEEIETAESVDTDFNVEDFDLPQDTFDDIPVADEVTETEDNTEAVDAAPADISDFDADAALAGLGDLNDLGDFGLEGDNSEFSDAETPEQTDSFDLPDTFGETDTEQFDIPEDSGLEIPETGEDMSASDAESSPFDSSALDSSSSDSFDIPGGDDFGVPETFDLPDDFDTGAPSNLFDASDVEIPDYGDDTESFSSQDDSLAGDGDIDENGGEIEEFDTSEMEGLDFPETDLQLDSAASDFDLGSSDEFPMEGSFEIPGFSDVETAKEEKSSSPILAKGKDKKSKKKDSLDEPDFSGAIESENLPPNTLSDAQYKQFIKNLSEYPLNVRLAFENLIVQDEFTDDAEFEIIEKILEKAPARQVASHLEKMLDVSIPVPRDFEHRTAEEYEAYKKSLSYQLKNKIIPGALIGILLIFVGIGVFNFGKHCIYIPAKANSLYKQGYTLLQASEYPQSEMKFEEAVKYRLSKKWFFNYARGYREHKQYQRAGQMYSNILRCFNHDKTAGLEYAGMELNDLADYETAETIVKREILDYHINDSDALLLLGDVFLEWGTEKDPEKLNEARAQYATLMQLYGASDLYLSRMMRYFIRTDNFREVLQLKQTFEPREKSLGADDWTELSGYLLDKSYGPISPSELYLRYQIEGLRKLLLRAAHANPQNPIALYNLSRYFVQTQETGSVEQTLKSCIEKFNALDSIKRRDIYKYIDSYRLLGEYYIDTTDYLQALEQFAEGIHLYTTERDNAGFEGTPKIGKLYEDFGNIKYFISGDYDEALENYKNSVELENDSPELRYRIGYIQYKNKNYLEALGSFMKSGEGNVKERNLLHAMANTLSLRGDDYAAEGYYEQLINNLNREIENKGIVLPQTVAGDYDVVNTYLSAANNYGVTLYRLAKRTGNSELNAQAIVQFSQSVRAWDALTRNQESLVRLSGSNLAEQNILYVTHSMPDFEPSIYIDIKKTLTDAEGI